MMPLDDHYDRDALGPTLARMETKLDPCREDYLDYREATRERCNEIEEAAGAAETLEDLQAVDTGNWPESPEAKEDLTITEPET